MYYFIILYYLLFPLGQLLRFQTSFLGVPFALHAIDVVILFAIPITLFNQIKLHPLRIYFYYFWYISLFSLLLAMVRYPASEIIRGSFYVLRFIAYYFFFEIVWNYVKNDQNRKEHMINLLVGSLFVTAVIGWVQYFYAPDLRYLKIFNWDDHYYRLAGSILDPGFTGILMVFGILITGIRFIQTKKITQLILSLFFSITMAFTYARAAYIALIAGVIMSIYFMKKLRYLFIVIALLAIIIPFLPKGEGEGVNLLRTNSIFDKLTNYKDTVEIISDFPVFGVGYNTLCSERVNRFDDQTFETHSCSGSDSSILFVIATTGILGLFASIQIASQIVYLIKPSKYSAICMSVMVAILVHSLFLNSLFYPWVMGIIVTLFALTI